MTAFAIALAGSVLPSLDTQGTSCTTPLTQQPAAQWVREFKDNVANELDHIWTTRANALRQCGSFAVQLKCRGCDAPHLVPFRCGARTCPDCARLGAAAMAGRVGARVALHDLLMEQQPWDGIGPAERRSWRMLTLTSKAVAHIDDRFQVGALRRQVRTVRQAFGKFWRSTPWGSQVRHGAKRKRSRRDTSYIYAIEISPRGMVHAHVLVYGEYSSQAALSELWSRALGERARLDVRAVRDRAGVSGALREVLKYATKGESRSPAVAVRAAHVELALRNVHRIALGGALRNVRISDSTGAVEDVTAADLHDCDELSCHSCGLIGEWRWSGIVEPGVVQENGGFGILKRFVAPFVESG